MITFIKDWADIVIYIFKDCLDDMNQIEAFKSEIKMSPERLTELTILGKGLYSGYIVFLLFLGICMLVQMVILPPLVSLFVLVGYPIYRFFKLFNFKMYKDE